MIIRTYHKAILAFFFIYNANTQLQASAAESSANKSSVSRAAELLMALAANPNDLDILAQEAERQERARILIGRIALNVMPAPTGQEPIRNRPAAGSRLTIGQTNRFELDEINQRQRRN